METLNLMPFAVLWGVLALIVLVLIVMRRKVAVGEDATIHVMEGDAREIPHQKEIAQKLEVIDKWGKLLTIIAVVYGLILASLWVYQSWIISNKSALQ
jgi:hypothetical protein